MGMYDQNANFEDSFEVGDRFAITGLKYEGSITTRFGQAERTTVTIVTRDSYPKQVRYSALGVGFANMAKQAERADFPHVAEFIVVDLPASKTLKRFAKVDVTPREWVDGDDGPPVDLDAFKPASASASTDTDIPF